MSSPIVSTSIAQSGHCHRCRSDFKSICGLIGVIGIVGTISNSSRNNRLPHTFNRHLACCIDSCNIRIRRCISHRSVTRQRQFVGECCFNTGFVDDSCRIADAANSLAYSDPDGRSGHAVVVGITCHPVVDCIRLGIFTLRDCCTIICSVERVLNSTACGRTYIHEFLG